MNRGLTRQFIVAAAVLVLTFTIVPTASALPREAPRTAFDAPVHWFEGVLSRVAEFFAGRSPQLQDRPAVKVLSGPVVPPQEYTGVCIDPWGNRIPCSGPIGG
jgi:hypothetical protein